MKTNQEHFKKNQQGIGLVYVLVAIALFAALSFILVRLSDSDEASVLSPEQSKLFANQLIGYVGQARSSIDQMVFSGTDIADIKFDRPGQAAFDADRLNQLHHPDGGGLNVATLPAKITGDATAPSSGWYFGRFNNVDWTPSTDNDVLLTAYDIPAPVCSALNTITNGNDTIPTVSDNIKEVFINAAYHSGSNENLTTTNCADCENIASLCVKDNAGIHAFYNVLVGR